MTASACPLKIRFNMPERASKHRTIVSPQPVKTIEIERKMYTKEKWVFFYKNVRQPLRICIQETVCLCPL